MQKQEEIICYFFIKDQKIDDYTGEFEDIFDKMPSVGQDLETPDGLCKILSILKFGKNIYLQIERQNENSIS